MLEFTFDLCLLAFLSGARIITLKGIYERIRTKFSIKNAKQTQFFRVFHPKMMISLKNKANSNPIQSQTNPILAQKSGWQTQFKPKTNPMSRRLKNDAKHLFT